MRIGIDAYPLSRDKMTGLGSYLTNLLRELEVLDKDNEYLLYACRDFKLPFKNERWKIRIIDGPKLISRISTLWLAWRANRMLSKDGVDIFVGTQNFIPPAIAPSIKKVLVLHDLCLYVCPQNVPLSLYLPQRIIFPKSLQSADRIVAISESTRSDIKRIFPLLDEKKIKTVYNGGPDQAFTPCDKKEALGYLLQKFGISGRFILTVTSLEWRKNVTGLLRAFDLCRKKLNLPHKLLIAGGERRAGSNRIYRLYKKLSLEDSVLFLGYLDIKELRYLYNAAELLVFPSFYEGFGLPPLEAMACRLPTVVSDIPVFREIMQEASLFADPNDPEKLAEKISEAINNQALRGLLIQKGQERIKEFSWAKAAKEMLNIFNTL